MPSLFPKSRLQLLCSLASAIFVAGAVAAQPATDTQHPIADKSNYELSPGLELSLFAREPDVVDPVALTFDEHGRMYVVEMRDYPYGIGPEHKPGGTIRLLEDTDGDGRADRSTLFAKDLSFPTSVAAWNGGILVTAPPEVIFLKDTDGDGTADVREVLLRGFKLGVTDSNVNGLRWGLDNRVHGNNGGNGGSVVSTRRPGDPVSLRGLDFSFDPATGDFTSTFQTSGGFGLVFDDWGRSFATYNINHMQQRIIPARYLARFPGMPPVETTQSISDHEEMSIIYPISTAETRPNHPEQSGHFSAAGGVGYIGAAGFPGDLGGSVLVCDVVGNLVHRDVLKPDGPVFTATRSPGEQTREFFASRDLSFRPTGVELGPDGALYLIDMQRDVIEHPDYIPEKVRAKIDLRAGEDRGRIYRLAPPGKAPLRKSNLGNASTTNLIAELSNPNQWRRVTAQRLLVERRDPASVKGLTQLALEGTLPLGRLHALWALRGLNALDESVVRPALSDSHPGIRENALILAEPFLTGPTTLSDRILGLAADDDPRVRFQTALTLGELNHPNVAQALKTILLTDLDSRWTRLAIYSSQRTGADALLVSLLSDAGFTKDATGRKIESVRELADLASARDGAKGVIAVANALVDSGVNETFKLAILEGIQSGTARHPDSSEAGPTLAPVLAGIESGASPALQDPDVASKLIRHWRSLTPTVRPAVIGTLLQRTSFHPALLEAIETGTLKLGELNLDLEQRRRLLRDSTPDVKARAAKLMGDEEYSNRKTIVDQWLSKLPASGDANRGRAVFEKNCTPCHAIGDLGHQVGPDLTAVSHRSVEDLLSNILDPNMAINPGFITYSCEFDSGELETGILASESTDAITLVQAAGRKVVVPRKSIKRLESTGLSLMPEGLEAGMTPADLRDLIAFLQERR